MWRALMFTSYLVWSPTHRKVSMESSLRRLHGIQSTSVAPVIVHVQFEMMLSASASARVVGAPLGVNRNEGCGVKSHFNPISWWSTVDCPHRLRRTMWDCVVFVYALRLPSKVSCSKIHPVKSVDAGSSPMTSSCLCKLSIWIALFVYLIASNHVMEGLHRGETAINDSDVNARIKAKFWTKWSQRVINMTNLGLRPTSRLLTADFGQNEVVLHRNSSSYEAVEL